MYGIRMFSQLSSTSFQRSGRCPKDTKLQSMTEENRPGRYASEYEYLHDPFKYCIISGRSLMEQVRQLEDELTGRIQRMSSTEGASLSIGRGMQGRPNHSGSYQTTPDSHADPKPQQQFLQFCKALGLKDSTASSTSALFQSHVDM